VGGESRGRVSVAKGVAHSHASTVDRERPDSQARGDDCPRAARNSRAYRAGARAERLDRRSVLGIGGAGAVVFRPLPDVAGTDLAAGCVVICGAGDGPLELAGNFSGRVADGHDQLRRAGRAGGSPFPWEHDRSDGGGGVGARPDPERCAVRASDRSAVLRAGRLPGWDDCGHGGRDHHLGADFSAPARAAGPMVRVDTVGCGRLRVAGALVPVGPVAAVLPAAHSQAAARVHHQCGAVDSGDRLSSLWKHRDSGGRRGGPAF